MKYIWHNGYVAHTSVVQTGYHQIKKKYDGETPFIVPRHPAAFHLNPLAVNIFPECNITGDELRVEAPKLSELMAARATAIAALQRPVYLWWSGGLDSTAIACAILAEAPTLDVIWVLDQNSIDEYPEFYHKFIAGKPQVKSNLALYMQQDTLHIDGMWADELFGNYQAEKYVGSWEEQSWGVAVRRFLEEAAPLEAAFPSETLFQRLWWLEFCLAFQDANLRPYYNGSNRGKNILDRVEANKQTAWFSHPSWTAWAMQRQLANKFATYRECKQELRDYIFAFTKDAHYTENKLKVYSQGKLYYGWKRWIAEDGSVY
jgi:asparagine synthetase B (glutamine-hydrolysing)